MARKYIITGPRPTLPATPEEWKAKRKGKALKDIDIMERAHEKLVEEKNGAYLNTLAARTNEESVHGKIVIDRVKNAEMIKEKVHDLGFQDLAAKPLSVFYDGMSRMMAHRYPELSRNHLIRESRVLIEHVGGGNDVGVGDGEVPVSE